MTAAAKEDDGKAKSWAGASLGGAGVGTGLVGLAQIVGAQSTLGQIFTWSAPAAGFLSRWLLIMANLTVARYVEKWQVNGSLKSLKKQLKNPHTSPEHKQKIVSLIEEAESLIAQAELKRIKLAGRFTEKLAEKPQEVPGTTVG